MRYSGVWMTSPDDFFDDRIFDDPAVETSRGGAAGVIDLRIIATADLHGHMRSFDYRRRTRSTTFGLERAAVLIEEMRAERPGSVLLDGGDFLHGSALSEYRGSEIHPSVAGMNALDFDAAALGNHELDRGWEPFEETMAAARFPCLCANLLFRRGGRWHRPLPSWQIVERRVTCSLGHPRDLRIGLIGLIQPSAIDGMAPVRDGILRAEPMHGHGLVARRALDAAGADVVVAICHDGHEDETGALAALASGGVADAFVLGHSHRVFPPARGGRAVAATGRIRGVPAVQPGFNGGHVGIIDLGLSVGPRRRVLSRSARSISVGRTGSDTSSAPRSIRRVTRAAHRAALQRLGRPVGETSVALHTHLTALGRCPVVTLIGRAMVRAARNALAPGSLDGRPVVAMVSAPGQGGFAGPSDVIDIAPGALLRKDFDRLCPYDDAVSVVHTTAAELRWWLERSMSRYRMVRPGQIVDLVDPGFPPSDFDLPHGVQFTLDLSRPAVFHRAGRQLSFGPGRVADLRIDGVALAPGTPLLVATSSYRARGGGRMSLGAGRLVCEAARMRAAVIDELAAGAIARKVPQFRFRPVRHAVGVVRSGPGAWRYLSGLDLVAHCLRDGQDGFQRISVDLGALENAGFGS